MILTDKEILGALAQVAPGLILGMTLWLLSHMPEILIIWWGKMPRLVWDERQDSPASIAGKHVFAGDNGEHITTGAHPHFCGVGSLAVDTFGKRGGQPTHCGRNYSRTPGGYARCPECQTDKRRLGWIGNDPASNTLLRLDSEARERTRLAAVANQSARASELNGLRCRHPGCGVGLVGKQSKWCEAHASGSARAKRGRRERTWADAPVAPVADPATLAGIDLATLAKAIELLREKEQFNRADMAEAEGLQPDEICEGCERPSQKATHERGGLLLCDDCAEIIGAVKTRISIHAES